MKINKKGLKVIKDSEGLVLEAYLDTEGIWTIGYGHTEGVKQGMSISKEKAEEFLKNDVSWAELAVDRYVTTALNENQFSALCSFVFNVGSGAFYHSTMLKLINKGKFVEASEQFKRWDKGESGVLPGLVVRREKEKNLFLDIYR